MHNRREVIARAAAVAAALGAAGLLPAHAQAAWNKAAFDARNLDEALKALGHGRPSDSKDVVLTAPDIAENGAVVPMAASAVAPGVRRIGFVVEKNPTALAAVFDIGETVEPNVSVRLKMAQTSPVYAFAVLSDGRVLYTAREVKVTLGGCGG